MGIINNRFKSELKQLPFVLGKVIGGIMAVIGFPGVVIIITRKPDPSWSAVLPFLLAGIAGMVIFILSSRLLEKRMNEEADGTLPSEDQKRVSMISWSILLALVVIFLFVVVIITNK